MLVSLNWLKQYIDYGDLCAEKLGKLITNSGIEVDGIEYVTQEKSENIVVGYVKECVQHPNADKLKLCQVDVGEEVLQIVCGAPNVAEGQKVAVAKPGSILPGNFRIKKVKLRGVESNGMICSLQELSVGERFIPKKYEEGIVVLPEDAEVGESVTELLNLDDAILEFDLTPNRADALSMIGVAYEVAAILDKEVNLPKPAVETTEESIQDYISIHSEAPDLCPYYAGFLVRDVKIKESPRWMQNYLLAAGIRPINNVVDITNYVLMEYGQPLHAFDYDLLDSKEIVVRAAKEGEQIVTLDDQTRTLTADNLLITNGKEGIALAGVMGGANTEVHDGTKNVLIEAAYFDPQTVRKAVQQTGLRSDSSTRFERGVDPNRIFEAGLRACELLVQYADGKLVHGVAEFNELKIEEKTLTVNADQINKRLGTNISIEEMGDILRRLRFEYEINGKDLTITVPTRRGDIGIFEDIVEEIARIYGYDRLPYTLPENSSKPGGLSEQQRLKRRIKQYLQGVGLTEAITYSLTNENFISKFISPEYDEGKIYPIQLKMPMSEEHQYLRLSILPELLNSLAYNRARSEANVAFYEIGSIFITEEKQLTKQPEEVLRLSGALTGLWVENPLQQERKPVDFYVVKGFVEGLFKKLALSVEFRQAQLVDFHPGRCATLYVNDQLVGMMGQVHPAFTKSLDLKDTYVFDLNLDTIFAHYDPTYVYDKISRYPSVTRDVAFIVDEDVRAYEIQKAIEMSNISFIQKVEVFDVYTDEQVLKGKKSMAYRINFQHRDRTLTDEEVDQSFEQIIERIKDLFHAEIRSQD